MERIIRFGLLVVLMEVVTAIAIKLADGHPFSSMHGWKGIGLLALVMIVVGGLTWVIVAALTGTPIPLKTALPLAVAIAVGFVCLMLLMMGVGREWLKPVAEPFRHGGIWWPVIVFVACVAIWTAQLGGRRRR